MTNVFNLIVIDQLCFVKNTQIINYILKELEKATPTERFICSTSLPGVRHVLYLQINLSCRWAGRADASELFLQKVIATINYKAEDTRKIVRKGIVSRDGFGF